MSRAQPQRNSCAREARRIRAVLIMLGMTDHELAEPCAAELCQLGYRPRLAWRCANELTQGAVSDRFNELADSTGMRPGRISEFERWPFGPGEAGVPPPDPRGTARPTIRTLKTLAAIYGTTWEQLVDLTDLQHMPAADRREYSDAASRRQPRRTTGLAGELPFEPTHFTGRKEAIAELDQRIFEHRRQSGPGVHVMDGPPGVGKTALARFAVAEFGRYYPDGSIWVDLFGYTPGREPRRSGDILERLLLELEVPRATIENDYDRRVGQWRAEMRRRRMLIVFDNVATAAQVRDLLPNSPGCLVLITSRSRLLEVTGSPPLHLDVMNREEAEELLVKVAGLDLNRYDREAAGRVVAASGQLPLALQLIGRQIAHHGVAMLAQSATELTELIAQLRRAPTADAGDGETAEDILEKFTAADESVRVAFEMSYQRLADPELRLAVRILGWFPGPEISAEPLAAMVGIAPGRAKTLIRRLFEAGLLDPVPGTTRYRMHDFSRLCARLRAVQQDPPANYVAAIDRLIEYALLVARRANATGARNGQSHQDAAQASEWLTEERELLVGCVDIAGPTIETAELARLVAAHLCGRGHWSEAHRLYERALRIAEQLEDAAATAWALVGLGRVDRMNGHHERAQDAFDAAHWIAAELPDKRCLTEVLCQQGQSAWITGRHGDGREYFTQALITARAIGYRRSECDALDGLSRAHLMATHYREARACSQDAVRIAVDLDDSERVGTSRWAFAEVLRLQGNYDDARRHYTEILSIARHASNQLLEGNALRGLGHIESVVGTPEAARRYFGAALAIAQRLKDRYGEGWALWGLGNAARAVADYDLARSCYRQAWQLAREVNDPLGCIDALRGLGHVERHVGNHDRARDYYRQSLETADGIGCGQGRADALRYLGMVARIVGDPDHARSHLEAALELAEQHALPVYVAIRAELRQL